jgi:hypothetical protein
LLVVLADIASGELRGEMAGAVGAGDALGEEGWHALHESVFAGEERAGECWDHGATRTVSGSVAVMPQMVSTYLARPAVLPSPGRPTGRAWCPARVEEGGDAAPVPSGPPAPGIST